MPDLIFLQLFHSRNSGSARSVQLLYKSETIKGLRRKISMKLFYQFSSIFRPLQVIFIHYKPRIATAMRGL